MANKYPTTSKAALDAQTTRIQRLQTLESQIEELEDVIQTDYREIEQEFDRLESP